MNRHVLEQKQAPSRPRLRPGKRLAVTYRALSELKLDPKNPRRHDRRQIRQIARSIETFDFNVPILVDGQLNVIAGHGRVLAARELGYGEVPTIDLGHLNEAQKRRYPFGMTDCWRKVSSTSRHWTSTLASRRPVSPWPRSTSGSRAWWASPNTRIRPTPSPTT